MDALATASADELDGVVDDACLEEGGYVLLDGFDASGECHYERVLDRPRDRTGERGERGSLE